MIATRKKLLQDINSLKQLIPGDEYALYTKQSKQLNLDFVPHNRFFPMMDENRPKTLNDIELNVLSKSKTNYINNIFLPIIVVKQANILVERQGETEQAAIERWTESLKKSQNPSELIKLIEKINLRKKSQSKNKKIKKKSFLKKLLGL